MEKESKYPYVLFKITDSLYCINSKHISTIVQLPGYSTIPAAPAIVTGMFKYRNEVIQMLDLRVTLGLKYNSEECRDSKAIVLMLNGIRWGIVVDEIVAVEDLDAIAGRDQVPMISHHSYISQVMERPKSEDLIFELNPKSLSAKIKELETAF
jgi:chemotaxis signal transduction protein